MIEIEKPTIETVEISDDGTFGKFVVEPLERGYGTTMGNSLRRILLSSLPGAAVTSVQIDGALHEFTTVDITYDSDVEVLNPDLQIATLNTKGRLYMKINAETGRGYRRSEANKHENQPIGIIPVDSNFTPVSRVAYQVEDTRVGQRA